MLVTLKSPILAKAWGKYGGWVIAAWLITLFIVFMVSIPPADRTFALVDGVYYQFPIRCNFGVLRDSSGPVLDFNDNKIRCVAVVGTAREIRELGEIR